MAQEVRWRSGGHQISPESTVDILRFEVEDLNTVIKNGANVAELYVGLAVRGGLSEQVQVVPVSCFAITEEWTPQRLAEGTRLSSYRLVSARTLLAAGFPIWPTNVYLDGIAGPRNEVHYDLIVASGESHLVDFYVPPTGPLHAQQPPARSPWSSSTSRNQAILRGDSGRSRRRPLSGREPKVGEVRVLRAPPSPVAALVDSVGGRPGSPSTARRSTWQARWHVAPTPTVVERPCLGVADD